MKIAIVGAGAVGLFYGARLARAGADVRFLLRKDFEHVRREGIRVQSHDGDFHLLKVNACRATADIGPCDCVIIALKATANADLAELLPPLLREQTMLVTFQNGLGNEEFLADQFGAERVAGGLCFVCLNRTAPGVVRNFAHGAIAIGEYNRAPRARTRALADAFRTAGIHCEVVENLAEARWRKLVWNIPFNGLAIAAGGVNTAQILADDSLLRLTRGLMGEAIAAANKLGHPIPPDFAEAQIENTRSMGAYQPSSLVDFIEGRPVEVEALWGEPCRRGSAAGVEMPRLETLYLLLKKLTASAH